MGKFSAPCLNTTFKFAKHYLMQTQAYLPHISQIHQILHLFSDSFRALRVQIPTKEIERLAFFVHQTMQGTKRKFHTTAHVLEICEGMNPIQTLAGLFHDVVYWQVDEGFPKAKQGLLNELVEIKQNEVWIREKLPQNLVFEISLQIFGFEKGQKLIPIAGLNEFLSTVVALDELRHWLLWKDLLGVAACIEGTIPFRHFSPSGISYWELLAQKLQEIGKKYEIRISEEEIETAVRNALIVANRDVANFAQPKIGHFLDNTWRLLPETNVSMEQVGVYTLTDYRKALGKMEFFLGILKPEVIFHQYGEIPNETEYQNLLSQARQNLHWAYQYLGAKIAAVSIVEALAWTTGGDAPIAMFLGDVRGYESGTIEKAESYFPDIELLSSENYNPIIASLLAEGRTSPTDFDLQRSPLASFTYRLLGKRKVEQLLFFAKEMFAEKISSERFLEQIREKIHPELVSFVAKACSNLAFTRKNSLEKWIL